MVDVSRVLINWTGSPVVGGGVSVLHCTPGDEHDLMAAARVMLNTCAAAFPTGLQWTFPPAGDVLDEASGDVVSTWTDVSPVAALAPAGGTAWVNGVGLRVKWTTSSVYGGHLVVGSTFMVPITSANYEGAGNILDSVIGVFQGAASTFVSAAVLRIYARKRLGLDGASFPVNGAVVPDRVSWLRGRRT